MSVAKLAVAHCSRFTLTKGDPLIGYVLSMASTIPPFPGQITSERIEPWRRYRSVTQMDRHEQPLKGAGVHAMRSSTLI